MENYWNSTEEQCVELGAEIGKAIRQAFGAGRSHQAAAVSPSNSSDLLNDLIADKERYKTICAADNPDHWNRGYSKGYLDAINEMIRKIKMGI